MDFQQPYAPGSVKTLFYIENEAINTRLLRKIILQHKDVALLTAHYDRQALDFIRDQQPELIAANIHALGNHVNQIYKALVKLHEVSEGQIIATGFDTRAIRVLTGWMKRLHFIDFPMDNQELLSLVDKSTRIKAA